MGKNKKIFSYMLILCFMLSAGSVFSDEARYKPPSKSPVLAGLCSFVPFGGQIYNGELLKGFLMLLAFGKIEQSGFNSQFNIGPGYYWFFTCADAVISAGEINKKIEYGPGYSGYKSPARAAFWSIVVPGGGQVYNGQFQKAFNYFCIAGLYFALVSPDKALSAPDNYFMWAIWLHSISDARTGATRYNSKMIDTSMLNLVPYKDSVLLSYSYKF